MIFQVKKRKKEKKNFFNQVSWKKLEIVLKNLENFPSGLSPHFLFYFFYFFFFFFNFLIWSETNTLISDWCLELKRDFQDQHWAQSFVFLREIIARLRERQNPMFQPCSPGAVWVVCWEPARVISVSKDYREHLGRADKCEDGPMSGRNRVGRGWKEAEGGVYGTVQKDEIPVVDFLG